MIKYKEQNKYSLNAESYGISKVKWKEIKEYVIANKLDSVEAVIAYKLNEKVVDGKTVIDEDLRKKRVWFLYDKLLQEKYNHLYKREKLVNPKVGDYVYADYISYGRGTIKKLLGNESMMIKFDKREFMTLCNSKTMTIVSDDLKRKITRL